MQLSSRGLALLAGVACSLLSEPARADGMYCGSRLVSRGDTLYQVRSVCGEPDDAQRRIETRTERRRVRVPCGRDRAGARCESTVEQSIEVVVDDWTYDQGRQRFLRFLTFVDGRLAQVQTGGYGTRDDR
jgi:Protein of unknown function (DUF2845)